MSGKATGTCKIITRAIVFLILGAIVNVAVAWGCCLRYPPGVDLPYFSEEADLMWWKHVRPEGFSDVPLMKAGRRAFGWRSIELYDVNRNAAFSVVRCPRAIVIRSGWPLLAFEGSKWMDASENVVANRSLISLDWAGTETRVIAVEPIWPGFAINTLLYGAILWLLLAAPFALRRWRRIKRGLCPACAYPVGSSAVCTECGRPLSIAVK